MVRIRLIPLILILGLNFQPAFADDFFKVRDQIIEESLFRLGFFYVTPRLTLENLGYNSNIYQYNSDPEPDWTADIGMNLRLATLFGKRFIFSVSDNPFFSFYLNNRQEQCWNNEFRFSTYSYLGPFNFKFTMKRDDIRRRPTSEFGIRVRHMVDSESISIDYGNHDRLYISILASTERMNYEDDSYLGDYDLSFLLDQEQKNIGMSFNKIIFSRTELFLNFGYFDYRFKNFPDRDGEGESVSAGLKFPAIGNVVGSFEIGYKWNHPRNPLYDDYASYYGTGEVKTVLFKRFRLSFGYHLGNYFSFYRPDYYFNEQSVNAGLQFYLTSRLKFGYGFNTGLLIYKDLEESNIRRKDRRERSRIFVGIKIFKKMGIGLEYTNFKVESDELQFSRNYDLFGGYITYDF